MLLHFDEVEQITHEQFGVDAVGVDGLHELGDGGGQDARDAQLDLSLQTDEHQQLENGDKK